MASQLSFVLGFLVCFLIGFGESLGHGHGGDKHFVIHVPLKVKTHHHTHTVYKHIHHGGGTEYKLLGYTYGKSHDHGHHGGFAEDSHHNHIVEDKHEGYGHSGGEYGGSAGGDFGEAGEHSFLRPQYTSSDYGGLYRTPGHAGHSSFNAQYPHNRWNK